MMDTSIRQTLASPRTIRVHVRRSVLLQGALVCFALTIPTLVTLYWLAIPAGLGAWVLALQILVMAASIVSVVQFLRASVSVTETELVEVGFFGPVHRAPISEIGRAIILPFGRYATAKPTMQMFVLDRSGRLVLRMRGEYWTAEDIQLIAEQLVTVPVEHVDTTVTLDELQRTNPRMLYWFERRLQRSR